MAKKDNVTAELPGLPKRPGRPATGKALSGAERQRRYRESLKERSRDVLVVEVSGSVLDALKDLQRRCREQNKVDYDLSTLADGAIRSYLVKLGYSFAEG